MRYWSLLLAAVLAACSSDDPEPAKVCAPGQQIECACPGGSKGAQVCDADGGGYGACAPCDVSAGGSGGSAGASLAEQLKDCTHDPVLDADCVKQVGASTPAGYMCKAVPSVCVRAPFGALCCPLPLGGHGVERAPRRAVKHQHDGAPGRASVQERRED